MQSSFEPDHSRLPDPAQYFLSALSHEIRTPLNGIIGYTQMLLQTKLDTTQQSYIGSMNHCCIQLVELVNDILDFSQLTAGKAQIHNECFSIKEVIEEVNATIGYRLKEKSQVLQYIVNKEVPEYIISDKQKIIQVLINLLSNANKFTPPKGRIIVSVTINDPLTIEFSVEDNGIGISLENQKKLFHPFVQIENNVENNGHGLGLAICKKLVQLLHGDIWVESCTAVQQTAQTGSKFIFTIKHESYEQYSEYIQKSALTLKNKYILIIDNNVDNRVQLGEILFEYGIRPIICSSAKEAVRMVSGKRYPFILALIDLYMPDMPGNALAKELSNIDPNLVLVGLQNNETIEYDQVFSQYIIKPVNKIKLLDLICRVVNKNDISNFQLNDLEEKEATPSLMERPKSEQLVKATKPIRILIAEDISYNSEMLVKMLTSMGYSLVDTVGTGEDAIKKIDQGLQAQTPFHILILDLKMPKGDGISVAEYLKNKGGNNLPKTIVVTASVLEADREKCRSLGIKYFLLKPINMTHLRNILDKIVNGTLKKVEPKGE